MNDDKKKKDEETVKVNLSDESAVDASEQEDGNFDYTKIDFDSLSDAEKKKTFDKLVAHNKFLLELAKAINVELDKAKAKGEGKVSDETYKRLAADYENYKKRNELAKAQAYEDGNAEVLSEVAKLAENFDRASAMITDEQVKAGVDKIGKLFYDMLGKFNVTEIKALGETFDPNLHNCVMSGEAKTPDEVDKVVEVFQKGFKLGDRILCHSLVKVAK